MIIPTIQDGKHPVSSLAQGMQDVLLVSSFGLWAVLFGFAPVLVFHVLTGS
jgi:hypothetical protein